MRKTKPKMVTISFQLPEQADEAYRKEAERRFVSKSDVIREVLLAHADEVEGECPQTPLAKTR